MTDLDFESQELEYEFIAGQHGGYWRHGFIDHAYLYNLYFPPEAVLAEFKSHIRDLVLNYPVAQDVLARLVGELIGQPPERIVVGNGAAELIKIVSGHLSGRLIVPVPSFNEYVNAVISIALDKMVRDAIPQEHEWATIQSAFHENYEFMSKLVADIWKKGKDVTEKEKQEVKERISQYIQ